MVDNANGRTRKRARIGLTLAPDVMDILDKHGDREGNGKPTRTEIIEAAVRMWDGIGMRIFTREELQKIMSFGQSEGVKRLITEWKRSNGSASDRSTAPPDDNTDSLSPEAKQARDEKKQARAERKAALSDTINKALPLKRDKIVSIPKPGKTK